MMSKSLVRFHMKYLLSCIVAVFVLQSRVLAAGEDDFYQLGPDSLVQERVPQGKIIGPTTLPSEVFPGTQHTYFVFVPAQYDPSKTASLMIFNDGQAFLAPDGNVR